MSRFKEVLWLLLMVMVVDLLGYVAWAVSGQFPVDGFYIGAITHGIVKVLIGS